MSSFSLAKSYTAFGEPCKDDCAQRGYGYTWCHKRESSSIGPWADSGHCSVLPNVTSFGDLCIDGCERRGQRYYWCNKDTTSWGYCTPEFLYKKTLLYNKLIKTEDPLERPPRAFTVYGEACIDDCQSSGDLYTWCTKSKPSGVGTWTDRDYCTTSSSRI